MQRFIDGWHSPSLNKWMEIVTYGHYGFPLLMFPTAAADYLEYERFYVIDSIASAIDSGKVKVFSINSINNESWLNREMPTKYKAIRQVQYNDYIIREVVPYVWNSCRARIGIITAGASLGAFHCANQLFRRPDLFDGCIAMSGAFDIRSYYSDDYYDDNVYFNNPVDYLAGLTDPFYLQQLQQCDVHLVTGSGPYEDPSPAYQLSAVLAGRGIPHHLDDWGADGGHDWPYWKRQMDIYIGRLF